MMSRIIIGRAGWTFLSHLRDYLYLITADTGNGRAGRTPTLAKVFRPGVFKGFLERSAMAALLPRESHSVTLHQPAMRPLFRLLVIHLQETLGYTPKRRFSGPLVLFKSGWADERPFYVRGDPDETYGWSKLAGAGVIIRRVTGDHLSVIRMPHVKGLAAQLRAEMDAASNRAISSIGVDTEGA